jgi:hypothetical protein
MDYYQQITRRRLNNTTRLFLSPTNICKLHNTIIDRVEQETGHRIFRQDDDDLLHFMYETLEIYDMYVITDDATMVRFLNSKTIDTCVSRIKNEMLMHAQYIKDASKLPDMIPRGKSTTTDHSISLYHYSV